MKKFKQSKPKLTETMTSYRGEFWTNGVSDKIRPDIIIQIKMIDRKHREKWTAKQKLEAKVWMIEQLDRLNDFITKL
jgi:hypothetical protein